MDLREKVIDWKDLLGPKVGSLSTANNQGATIVDQIKGDLEDMCKQSPGISVHKQIMEANLKQ